MIKKIAFIGATGNLAPFAYHEILKKGIQVTALVRTPLKAKLPEEIDVIQADLQDYDSLLKGFEGMDAVYLNISTTNPKADFQPEIDGIKNVIKAAKKQKIKRIYHVSAMTVPYPHFAQGKHLSLNEIRKQGYRLLNESGIPCTFFHCSWIMDVMEYAMREGGNLRGFKPANRPFYWLAGKDLGEMIGNAVASSNHNENKDYMMQGRSPILFEDALNRYAKTHSPHLKVQIAPAWMLHLIGFFKKEIKMFAQFADFFANYEEEFKAEQTWAELGEPKRTIENFRA